MRADYSALLLRAIDFTVQCGACDAGLTMKCVCPQEDPRGLVGALAEAVQELRRDSAQLNSMCYTIGSLLGMTQEGAYSFDASVADILKKLNDEYLSLKDSSDKLLALETAGVDNWNGYDYAKEIYREMKGEPEDD